jgi:hypothetical protein
VLLPADRIATADRALVERILADSGVERSPVPPRGSYPSELAAAAWQRLIELVARGAEALRLSPGLQVLIVAGLVGLALAALAWTAVVLLRRRRAALREAAAVTASPAVLGAAWDAGAWRAELERCLAEGRTGEALQAAWWWLARSIAGSEAEPDWTSRDLLARTPRGELRGLLRRLDALTFGAERPGLADVSRLAEQIRGALG